MKPGFWSVMLGAGAVAGLGLWGRKKWIGEAKKRSLDSTDRIASAASLAQKFIQAFHESGIWGTGAGTDEKLVFETLYAIPDRETWQAVRVEYFKQRERKASLSTDLQSELRPEEQDVAQAITHAYQPARYRESRFERGRDSYLTAWSRMLHWSLKLFDPWFWGGIEWPTIRRVLRDLPGVGDVMDLRHRYRELFDEDLLEHLSDELSGEQLTEMKTILMNKADAKGKSFSEVLRGG